MRFLLVFLLLSAWPGRCQIRDVVKSAEIDQIFARTMQSLEVLAKTNYAVQFRVSSKGPGARQTHPDADEFWFVRYGAAKVALDGRQHDVAAGDVVSVPRTTPYQITPTTGRFEYVAVRIFPTGRRLRMGIGAAPKPHPMPDVVAKAQIDATLASADKNVAPPFRRSGPDQPRRLPGCARSLEGASNLRRPLLRPHGNCAGRD